MKDLDVSSVLVCFQLMLAGISDMIPPGKSIQSGLKDAGSLLGLLGKSGSASWL